MGVDARSALSFEIFLTRRKVRGLLQKRVAGCDRRPTAGFEFDGSELSVLTPDRRGPLEPPAPVS